MPMRATGRSYCLEVFILNSSPMVSFQKPLKIPRFGVAMKGRERCP